MPSIWLMNCTAWFSHLRNRLHRHNLYGWLNRMFRASCRKIVRNILPPSFFFWKFSFENVLFICFEIIIDSQEDTKKYFLHAPFIQAPPALTSRITIVQYQNQEWTLVQSRAYLDFTGFTCTCVCVSMQFYHMYIFV